MLKVIIFDFDGVIGNTFNVNLKVWQSFDPKVTVQQYRDHHNGNVYEQPTIYIDPKDIDLWNSRALELFTSDDFFPMKDVLSSLSKQYPLLIVTSMLETTVEGHLRVGGYESYFKEIYGYTKSKSKVEKFKMAMKDYNFKPDECVYITDTLGDIEEAHKAGIKVIAVTWGYHDRNLLETAKPEAMVDTPEELLNLL
jgi:phosphoglycolate phosphatase